MRQSTLLLFALLITACGGFPVTTFPQVAPSSTSPQANIPSPTSTSRPTPTATHSLPATPQSCAERSGTIVSGELADADLPRSLPYRIYLPPCSSKTEQGELPSLYLLHGLTYTDSQWDDLGIDEAADALITAGRSPPLLIVMPWERKGLDFEAAIVEHLVPYIGERYHGRTDGAGRAIGGLSRGGGWALRIGLKHPEVFGAVGLHSPAVLVPDLYDLPVWVTDIPARQLPRIWVDIGDRDPLRRSVLELQEAMDAAGLSYTLRVLPGDHSSVYWAAHLQDYLLWYTEGW